MDGGRLMIFTEMDFQLPVLQELESLANRQWHSLLISGPSGSGKSYLAKQYVRMLGAQDFASITPKVDLIREALEAGYKLSAPIVYCIENLDAGTLSASYTLLKFLEDPAPNVYVIITCQNIAAIPDTILSRCACLTLSPPTVSAINTYAKHYDEAKWSALHKHVAWSGVKSFKDVEYLYNLTSTQLAYYDELSSILTFKDTVSNIIWKLGHYSDNSEINIPFMFNCIVATTSSAQIRKHAINCMRDYIYNHIAIHAVLAKFVLECKYGE